MFVFRFLGREAEEVEPILDALPNLEQYVMTIGSVKSNKNNQITTGSYFCFLFRSIIQLFYHITGIYTARQLVFTLNLIFCHIVRSVY